MLLPKPRLWLSTLQAILNQEKIQTVDLWKLFALKIQDPLRKSPMVKQAFVATLAFAIAVSTSKNGYIDMVRDLYLRNLLELISKMRVDLSGWNCFDFPMQIELTDEQWQVINQFIPRHRRTAGRKGRPNVDNRLVLNGILWIMWTGSPWAALPAAYGSRATCHRRHQQWSRDGTLKKIFKYVVQTLELEGKITLSETFIDGSFASAKKGVLRSERPSEERVRSGCLWLTGKEIQSESQLRALLRMKLNWQLMQLRMYRRREGPKESSATKPTRVKNFEVNLQMKA